MPRPTKYTMNAEGRYICPCPNCPTTFSTVPACSRHVKQQHPTPAPPTITIETQPMTQTITTTAPMTTVMELLAMLCPTREEIKSPNPEELPMPLKVVKVEITIEETIEEVPKVEAWNTPPKPQPVQVKSYLDLLPEDCLRLIYKNLFNECIKELPQLKNESWMSLWNDERRIQDAQYYYFFNIRRRREDKLNELVSREYNEHQGDMNNVKVGDIIQKIYHDDLYKIVGETEKSFKIASLGWCKIDISQYIRYDKYITCQRGVYMPNINDVSEYTINIRKTTFDKREGTRGWTVCKWNPSIYNTARVYNNQMRD